MLKLRWVFSLFAVFSVVSSTQGSTRRWQTLTGNAPLVIARGGFSGLFPDSSFYAYSLAVNLSLANVHLWCDVQLTKDGAGICFPNIRLQNSSDIDLIYSDRSNTYNVNGVPVEGWFSTDFTLSELSQVNLKQGIYIRTPNFDNTIMPILTVDQVVNQTQPPALWLSVPHGAFFSQHNLNMRSFILSVSRRVVVNYISSPELGFLRSIVAQFRPGTTNLVFQFLGQNDVEPTTNQTYGSLLGNLTLIRTVASGILVPKDYILRADSRQYLLSYTSLVQDAHAAGLQVFASNFANDANLPYNYSYDPVSEYLSFVDNGQFSVDGFLSDFPLTPSATIDCFSHMKGNEAVQANVLIISNEGASGDYPGCTDRAYQKAASDGVDILDCLVQISNDGIPFCLGSINLRDRTNAAESDLRNFTSSNPDLNIEDGIFAYSLTWSQIQSLRHPLAGVDLPYICISVGLFSSGANYTFMYYMLKMFSAFEHSGVIHLIGMSAHLLSFLMFQTLPTAIFNPYLSFSLLRNPSARSDGKLLQLSEFLALANNASSVSGVMISIENAAYLATNQGLGVVDAVLAALNSSGFDSRKRIMIRSSDSAVLSRFRSNGSYELVYLVDEDVSEILNSTILEIRKFASSVVVSKRTVFPTDMAFIIGETNVVPMLQAFNLSVYVQYFRNEFVSQSWDFLSDAYVEINTFVSYMGINGIITDFPATAARYRRNRCLGYTDIPNYMAQIQQPGALLTLMTSASLPPAEAPSPSLQVGDVVEPPIPPVVPRPSPGSW